MDDFKSDEKNKGFRKKNKMISGTEVLQSLFENGKSPLSEQFLRWKLWARWKEIVGPTISQNSEPVALKNGVLYIWVRNSTWLQQFLFMKDPIKETIHAKMNQKFVHSLRFTLDRHEVPRDENDDLKKTVQKIQGRNP